MPISEARKRYMQSSKGRKARLRYQQSPKGVASRKKYMEKRTARLAEERKEKQKTESV